MQTQTQTSDAKKKTLRGTKIIDGERCRLTKWTDSCSGCFEFNEGLGLSDYPIDKKHNIHLGSGCSECGYQGKVRHEMWVPIEFDPENLDD